MKLVQDQPKQARTIKLNQADNVAVAIDVIEPGNLAAGVTASERVMKGHKIAIQPIAKGEPIRKFGQVIGFATKDVAPGAWLHIHNVEMGEFARDYAFCQDARNEEILPVEQQATFQGYRRANGKAATRNYIGILTSVNCSATVASFIAQQVERSGILADYPNINGVVALTQSNGCVIDFRGAIFDILKRTSWGYATNANMGGVLMVGLGCEGFQI